MLKYLVEHEIGNFHKDGERVDILSTAAESERVDIMQYIIKNRSSSSRSSTQPIASLT